MNAFKPDYLVSPGDVLAEYLESLGMTTDDVADKSGLDSGVITGILSAKVQITPEAAVGLERAFGHPACFWIALERQYQSDLDLWGSLGFRFVNSF